MKIRIRRKGNFFQALLGGVSTLIFINYLIVGFGEVVLNINDALTWIQQHNAIQIINQFIK